MIRTQIADHVAQAVQAQAAAAHDHYASALPGEWLMLWLLVVMAAVLGAAVLARGAVEHRRLQAQRVELWREWREDRRRAEQDERPEGRDCG
ncbi:MAG TPA: hypothetical protein VGX23_27730 [Actinocrinis sp.]|nr:hypothetical protein [Actinocrinis sp.]